MRTFILTNPKYQGELELQYEPVDGIINLVENRTTMDAAQRGWFFSKLPTDLPAFMEWEFANRFTIVEVPPDLDFDRFWKVWPGVRANRDRALQLWEKMTKHDKAVALWRAKAYARYIARNKHWYNLKYPDGWLRGKYYNNDYDRMHV